MFTNLLHARVVVSRFDAIQMKTMGGWSFAMHAHNTREALNPEFYRQHTLCPYDDASHAYIKINIKAFF